MCVGADGDAASLAGGDPRLVALGKLRRLDTGRLGVRLQETLSLKQKEMKARCPLRLVGPPAAVRVRDARLAV